MLYNKNLVRKTNDKKVLHKVGKQWKVISVALLMAIGGAAVATNANANASSVAVHNGHITNISSRLPKVHRNTYANADASSYQHNTQQPQQSVVSNDNTYQGQQNQSQVSNVNVNQYSQANSVNNNLNSSTRQLVQSLEATPNVQTNSTANSNTNSSTNSNSNSNPQASVTPQSSGSISYRSGDNGSAASYNNKAQNLSGIVLKNQNVVNSYANSLKAKYPTQINSLHTATSNANTKLSTDQATSATIGKLANASNRNEAISDAAKANNQTVSDFVQSIDDVETFNNANVKNTSGYASYANAVKSYADVINAIKTNSDTSAGYKFKADLASANYQVALSRLQAAQQMSSATGNELKQATNAKVASLALETNDRVALINSQADSNVVHNIAQKLGYNNNDYDTKLGIQSAADTQGAIKNGNVTLKTASGSTSSFNINNTANLGQVLSDTNVMDTYQSKLAKLHTFANVTSISAANASASSAVAMAANDLNSAKSASNVAARLANNPDFTDIITMNVGNPNDLSTSAVSSLNNTISSLTSASNTGVSNFNNASSAVNSINSKYSGSSASGSDASALASAKGVMASENAINNSLNSDKVKSQSVNNVNNLLAQNKATLSGFVSLYPGDTVINNDLANLSIMAGNSSAESSAMQQLNDNVSSLDNEATNASMSSASYEANSDVKLVTAPSKASSINSAIQSDQANVKSASNAVQAFNAEKAPSDFASASAELASDTPKLAQDEALATAYATHVYNYGPKYITNMHRMLLHQHTDYQADTNNDVQMIPKDSHLQVLGIGFAGDGTTRYVVNFNNTKGFVTANPSYTKPEYIMHQGKHIEATMIKNAQVYNTQSAIGKIKAGTQIKGTVVTPPDVNFNNKSVYGGYTRIKLDNGMYVTANTDYVQLNKVDGANNNNNNTNNNAPKNVHTIGFINF